MQRLDLAGHDDASVNKADAWLDTEACRQALNAPVEVQKDLIDGLGAYLGEAVIRRHGGTWDLSGERPMVVVKRKGTHFVDPIGKVMKRLLNGKQDDLPPRKTDADASESWASATDGTLRGTSIPAFSSYPHASCRRSSSPSSRRACWPRWRWIQRRYSAFSK